MYVLLYYLCGIKEARAWTWPDVTLNHPIQKVSYLQTVNHVLIAWMNKINITDRDFKKENLHFLFSRV